MLCQHGFQAGEHWAMGANVKVVLQYFTDQYAYGTKILGTDTLLVSSAQAFCLLRVAWGHCPCHFCPQSTVSTWHCPGGGRLPCFFLSTQPGQADRSLVLLRAGDRKQDHWKWKETGIAVPLRPLSAAAFHHNVWVPTMSRSQELPPARVPLTA